MLACGGELLLHQGPVECGGPISKAADLGGTRPEVVRPAAIGEILEASVAAASEFAREPMPDGVILEQGHGVLALKRGLDRLEVDAAVAAARLPIVAGLASPYLRAEGKGLSVSEARVECGDSKERLQEETEGADTSGDDSEAGFLACGGVGDIQGELLEAVADRIQIQRLEVDSVDWKVDQPVEHESRRLHRLASWGDDRDQRTALDVAGPVAVAGDFGDVPVRVDPCWEIVVVQRQAWGRVRGGARGLREAKAWVDERARRGGVHRMRLDGRSGREVQVGDLLDLEVGLTREAQRVEIHEVGDTLTGEPTHDRRVLRRVGGLDDGASQRDSLIEECGSLNCILDREPVVLPDARQVGEVAEQSVERRWHTRH
ncbi:MAG: hypothetical protein JSS99_06925 [Actinobacteria bacterium]|nr:hypothetical protein [Actinomycetota bacterium]